MQNWMWVETLEENEQKEVSFEIIFTDKPFTKTPGMCMKKAKEAYFDFMLTSRINSLSANKMNGGLFLLGLHN